MHDAIWDSIVPITRDVKFHVLCESKHMFPNVISLIIMVMNGYYAYSRWYSSFGKIVIINSIYANFVSQAIYFQGVLTTLQLKQRLRHITTNTLKMIPSL
jgi:hypothetical protein